MNLQPILLVEDNDDDAELTIKAFAQAKIKNTIIRVRDGVEALDYLLGRNTYADRHSADLPSVVLLDLNLPKMDGLEVLKIVRASEKIKHLPIVVLTSSKEDKDRLTAYMLYANSYVCKPVDYDNFLLAAKNLGLYWLVLNQPPPVSST